MREDFGDLPVRLRHLTIYLNFLSDQVEATCCLEMTALRDLAEFPLDANSLDILGIEWVTGPQDEKGRKLDYEYQRDHNRLTIKFSHGISKGQIFFIRTRSRCYPSDHILEGIYKDTTPRGAPQQFMSQCQQWGFQRIMPIIDDCRAKCTFTTTIEADQAYTHLISNGNVSKRHNPNGSPVQKQGNVLRQVITYENPVPMAPYLFIACVGTWDTLVDQVTYPSGKMVRLEYLVPPGSVSDVRIPMQILKESILWIGRTQGYEYTGDCYRTICMNKSNFGGMENVGNTTIVTDAALINEHTLDSALLYSHGVIVHEFEHNQCGSETTMETPFDVWLNEAYTVDVERQFMADVFDPSFIRLNEVESIRNPLLGPLTMEDAGHVGRIVREGFNDPDELIDGVTYVKAAEVIRMLRLILGDKAFHEGKTLYFSRFRNGNANTDQFFECFEENSGLSLEQFKQGWLYTIGYPKVTAETGYDPEKRQYRICFRQETPSGIGPFHLPVVLELVDKYGKALPETHRVFQLKEARGELVFDDIGEAPAFASMHRDYSFYGTFGHENAQLETLALQVKLDSNAYNRVDAMRQLTDVERIRLMTGSGQEVNERWLDLYGEVLLQMQLQPSVKAFFLRIDEQPMDRAYTTWFQELVVAREELMRAVNKRHKKTLVGLFESLDTYSQSEKRSIQWSIEARMLKNVLLELIAIDDAPESHSLILNHFRAATTATDRVAALTALNRSSSPLRHAVLEEAYNTWHDHLSGYANYLRTISSGTCNDVFEMIKTEKERQGFVIAQPTWARALFLPMATNNKMLWTDEGITWLADTVIELAPINAIIASKLLNAFQHVKRLKPVLRAKATAALERIVSSVPEAKIPTVSGQARAYLKK
jgi:aminopeptidase N